MYVRLAFAVAAHLEPEILIVDEVLAVGDAEFQKKCLGKMEDVSNKDGRTVILVSHQMPVIQNLCTRCILMDRGRLMQEGPTDEIVSAYMARGASLAAGGLEHREDRVGKGDVRVTQVNLRDKEGNIIQEAISGNDVVMSFSYSVREGLVLGDCLFCVEVCKDLQEYFSLSSAMVDPRKIRLSGEGRIDFLVPDWPLSRGTYHVNLYVESDHVVQDHLNDAAVIEVIDGDFYGTGKVLHAGARTGSVLVKHSWEQIVE
jgi:lipopolysaccharide transport system ATP-binding protein